MDRAPGIPAKTAQALRRAMADFARTDHSGGFIAANPGYRSQLGPNIAQSAVLHYLLHHALGFRDLGRFEKSAWEITFTYRGIHASVALQKFGLRLYLDRRAFRDAKEAKRTADDAVRDLERGLRIIEGSVLRQFADAQLRQGNVTFLNQAYRLREMHSYFRDGAMRSYESEGRMPERTEDGGTRIFVRETEGFYNTVAMALAYFSWLEHVLVLAHPFVSGVPTAASDIASFMRLGWRDKFKHLFALADGSEATAAYRRLDAVAEDYRNPWAHGALDRRGGAVGFHLPGSGAVAMSLRAADFTPSIYVLPFDRRGFDRADDSFQSVDAFLHAHDRTRLAMRWIEGGLDVAFDIESRIKYAVALASDELFEDLMDYTAYQWERHANMEY